MGDFESYIFCNEGPAIVSDDMNVCWVSGLTNYPILLKFRPNIVNITQGIFRLPTGMN